MGDNLLFYYNDQVDDVLEINSDLEFKSCDTISPVAVHNAGQDLIRLTKPGICYFITSKIGHCEAGLKLRIVVRPLSKSVPKKMQLSPFDRLIKWLHDSFTPRDVKWAGWAGLGVSEWVSFFCWTFLVEAQIEPCPNETITK